MNFGVVLSILIGNIFIYNFILSRFLGICPFIGVSKDTKAALSMGLAVIFVMVFSSMITWGLYNFVLAKYQIAFLRTITFILVIAVFVQLVEMIILKTSPAIHKVLGIYLPLITTNCAILGVAVLNIDTFSSSGYSMIQSFSYSLLQAFAAGAGFMLAILLMSGIREQLELSDVPAPFKGAPIAFIVASLMSMAFMGFAGFCLN